MPRFYIAEPLTAGALVSLPEALAHHVQVLRLAVGDDITLFNGAGGAWTARLCDVGKKRVTANITAHLAAECELPFTVTLAQALPEASKMDWIIEKAVELGAAGVQPLAAQRSVVRLSAERAEKRRTHWSGVIISASEQCGRNRLAALGQLQDYKAWISTPRAEAGVRILLTPRASESLATWARRQSPCDVTLLVGPEGGLSDSEEQLALQHGAIALAMGPRILRTETAGLAALATLNGLWGGME